MGPAADQDVFDGKVADESAQLEALVKGDCGTCERFMLKMSYLMFKMSYLAVVVACFGEDDPILPCEAVLAWCEE
jgi:hypothetical protein